MSEQAAAAQPAGGLSQVVPGWIRGYRRTWLSRDVVAGIIVWSVVVPQAVAYAQIAGLPPQAGLVAGPGALLAYALLGSSRALVASATTATAAVSAAAVGAIAQGDPARFAALSATFALVVAVVFAGAGVLRVGGVTDLVSKPVMTGFLFGLGLTIAVGQLPKVLGIVGGHGNFFRQAWAELNQLGDISWWTFAVGATSAVLLVGCRRLLPTIPSTLAVLVLAIVVSTVFDLTSHGVAVVGKLPSAIPHLAWPDFSWRDVADLLAPAFGVILLSAEGLGVARSLATRDGYNIDSNRELVAIGGSNALAGLSQGFVQCGGASQTMAAANVGGKSQLGSVIAAALTLLTGAIPLSAVQEPSGGDARGDHRRRSRWPVPGRRTAAGSSLIPGSSPFRGLSSSASTAPSSTQTRSTPRSGWSAQSRPRAHGRPWSSWISARPRTSMWKQPMSSPSCGKSWRRRGSSSGSRPSEAGCSRSSSEAASRSGFASSPRSTKRLGSSRIPTPPPPGTGDPGPPAAEMRWRATR